MSKKGLVACHLCGIVVYGTSLTYHLHYIESHMDLEAERVKR